LGGVKALCSCGQPCGTAASNMFCQLDGACQLGAPATCAPCVCGAPCNIQPSGIIGVCHTQGSCQAVVPNMPPDCRPTLVHNPVGVVAVATTSVAACPAYKCVAPDCPVANQVTPTSNGCPQCPKCQCVCGAPCNVPVTGIVGVCHMQGVCQAVTDTAPDCRPTLHGGLVNSAVLTTNVMPTSTELAPNGGDHSGQVCPTCVSPKCAAGLTLYTPAAGVNGCPACASCHTCIKPKCSVPPCPVVQRMTPHGKNGCPLCPRCNPDLFGKGCPTLKCTPPPCSTDMQETPKSNGCNQCPRCKVGSCSKDSDCKDGSYCNGLLCQTYLPKGNECTLSVLALTRKCVPGTTCTSGTCQCTPLPCPHLDCHGQAQETSVLPNGCPGCDYCVVLTH